ncbi:MAG: 50S ribosomal protein L24 [Nitrospiraceae bacterium]|nr:MAG: 50S ribosomal protein L24 [Nitrospiraceae bacterium]UCH44943.1 MAG: 50S ribosomal protein L24 [Nitrospiraceae bacterium]
MALGLKKNDTIVVVSGNEKGKRGRVLSVQRGNNRIVVEKLNMIKRHMKPSKKYQQGGIIEKEGSIHLSNVMLVCTKCDKSTRIGQKILENGKKVRECRKCGEVID